MRILDNNYITSFLMCSATLCFWNSSDKDETDANDVEASMLGLQSYWDASYAEDLANFHEHGHAGEIWYLFVHFHEHSYIYPYLLL